MVKHWKLLALLALGLALRLLLMPQPDPFRFDLTIFWLPWMAFGAKFGLVQLYLHGEPVVNYPPLYLALLTDLGKLYRLLVPSFAYTPLQSVLIKLPAVLADLAIGVLLYAAALRSAADRVRPADAAAKPAGLTAALLAAALWLLNPAVIYVSAFWAQVDSLHTLWMIAALMAALGKRWGWSGLLLGLGLLTKLQAVVIAPLLLFMAWRLGWRPVARWTAACAGTLALGLLAPALGGALRPLLNVYTGAVGFYPALSMNAYNPWFVVQFVSNEFLGRTLNDTARVVGPVTLRWVGMALLAAYGLALLWILSRRWHLRQENASAWPAPWQRLDAFFAGGMLVFGFFTLATEMHERYSLPALAFLALPAALAGRQRLLAFLLLSAMIWLNLLRVLPFAPAVLRAFEGVPGDRLLIALAISGLFVWWTVMFWRGVGKARMSGW